MINANANVKSIVCMQKMVTVEILPHVFVRIVGI